MKSFYTILLFLSVTLISCRGYYGSKSYENVSRKVNAGDIVLPDGYKIESIAMGLNYPTAITFDDDGNIYVVESGYSYGEIFTTPQLLRIDKDGNPVVIAKGSKNGPWTSVNYYEGNFYIAEGGVMEGGKILKVSKDGKISELIRDLPSYGDHHTNSAIVKNGYVYFGQGTATNSAVVGEDNMKFGWLTRKNDFHDIPCEDVELTGENFTTKNVLSEDKEKVQTGAYVPYGTSTKEGQIIKGKIPCTGAVMRIPINGKEPELVAWGFRNPYGLGFSPQGKLYVTDNGYDRRGSRPVWGAGDLMWEVKEGTWYGWPDFSGEDSISGENFRAHGSKPKSVLRKHKNIPPKPAAVFGVHSSSNGFDFSTNAQFGKVGKAFVAQFGDMSPDVGSTVGWIGFKVVEVDVQTGVITDFVINKGKDNGPASANKSGGIERPIDVKFSKDGSIMYIVDFGVLEMTKQGPAPKKNTGMIWKVTHN